MATIRKAKRSKFSSISNRLLQDSAISFGCRGLLAYLLSKPDDWQCRVSDIEREGNIGITARRSMMVEAEKAGYLTYHRARDHRGRFADSYMVHEEPVSLDERTESWTLGVARSDEPTTDEPGAGFPGSDNPSAENPGGTNNTDLQKTDIQKKEKTSAANAAPHQILMDYLATKIGTYSDGKIQGKSVKWLLDHSYTVEQCKGCLDFLLSETWRTNRVSWQTVEKEIGNWLRRNPKLKISAEVEKVWQAMLDDLRAGLGCSDCETVNGKGNYPFGRGYVAFPYGDRQYPCKTCNPKLETHPKHELYLQMLELQSGGSVNGSVQR